MSLFEDITQEELEVFLQEADEQLLRLDEDLVELEKDGSNAELMQEIFRAAHTLKGSSAMVGLDKMSRVAHSAETVLDRLRNHTLDISTPVIDSLLQSLDVLKALRQELVSPDEEVADIESIINELETISRSEGEAAAPAATKPSITELAALEPVVIAEGMSTYKVEVEVTADSCWASVRCYQVLDELSQIGEIIRSQPSREEVENGNSGNVLEILLASAQDIDSIREKLGAVPELNNLNVETCDLDNTPKAVTIIEEKAEGKASPAADPGEERKTGTQKLTKAAQTVRVDVQLLDDLMNLVGEMVIERNRIRQTSKVLESKYEGDETIATLRDTSAHIMKLVNELQDNVLQARMLPVGTVFNGFPRLVRDLANKAKKKIDFIVEGQETELDRTIIEQIRDPLVHLLRNAVDHGIQPAQERIAAGKDEKGTILLSAYQEQNYIIIVVEDDGAGINVERVKEKAVNNNLISAEDAARLTDADAMNFIFAPGLSTASKVTEVSGRGVGMDVVRNNIESLGGSVHVESRLGEGSRFIIRLPFTLATINGLLVSSADNVYVIPMASLVEILNLRPEEVESVNQKDVIRVRGHVLPLMRLDEVFGIKRTRDNDDVLTVVVRTGEKSVGIVVDSIMETQDTVVKSLGKYVGTVKGIAGATILGDGRVALILDTATLVREVTGYGA